MKPSLQRIVVVGAVTIMTGWVSANASPGRELIFSGPIQKIDRGTDTVTVLGQRLNAQTTLLSIGEIVRVFGVLQKDGSIGDALVEGTKSFGANGDPVFLKGVVTNADPQLGRVEVDGLTVDYTSQLGNSQFSIPAIGDVIAVSGLQPTTKGVLVASATGDAAYAVQDGGTVAGSTMRGGFGSALSPSGGLATSQMVGTGRGAAQMVGTGHGAAQMVGTGHGAAQMVGTGHGTAQMVGTGHGTAQMVGTGTRTAQRK
jgi:hypothetical protein